VRASPLWLIINTHVTSDSLKAFLFVFLSGPHDCRPVIQRIRIFEQDQWQSLQYIKIVFAKIAKARLAV
jgi:hypothetical protein